MTSPQRTLITVATYNEIENLPKLVDEILSVIPTADILVVDDNSPDGTGRWCDERAEIAHAVAMVGAKGDGLGVEPGGAAVE